MTSYAFEKLQGAGNDFIFLDAWINDLTITAEDVIRLCDRHFGIGADGVIVVRHAERDQSIGFMDYWNADGTTAEMCGNGVRCFAKYMIDHGYGVLEEGKLIVDTRAGYKSIHPHFDLDGTVSAATVDMGQPIFEPALIPTTLQASRTYSTDDISVVYETPLESPFGIFNFTCVSMGNPHAVCFIDNFEAFDNDLFVDSSQKSLHTFDINKVGAYFETCSVFPNKTNVEFAHVVPDGILMRVYERGCGETLACGTGACATGVAAILTGHAQESTTVKLLGGQLKIEWNGFGNSVHMTGPAAYSFKGTVEVS